MTSDAKIGLLLALVFIVAITFVINGLPDFLSKNKVEQPTASYVRHYRPSSPGLIGSSRKVAPRLNQRKPIVETLKVSPSITATASTRSSSAEISSPSPRYQTILPQAGEVVKNASADDLKTATAVIEIEKTIPTTSLKPKTYIVKSGDSLAKIAIKLYGTKLGNKLSTIEAIFNANRKTVKSIDSIYVGQKLIIPNVASASQNTRTQTSTVVIGYKKYVVKENDNLWKIANTMLDDGSRYHEIIKLNKATLPNADYLTVGMTLKVPIR